MTTPMHQRRNPSSGNSGNGSSSGSTNNMYGRSGAYGRGGRADVEGGRHNDTNSNILEQQNNERIYELSEQVTRLKGLTIDIGNEVSEQNRFLDNMGDGFMNARDMLQGSLTRIGTMLESGGAKHMCYMVGFVVLVVIFLYWVMTYKGQGGA
jgi:blocked-early-in-transport protein 1